MRKAPRSVRWQDAEQRPTRGDPSQRALENADAELACEQIGHREGRERLGLAQVGAEQNAGGDDAGRFQNSPEGAGWAVQNRDRVAHERQDRAQRIEWLAVLGHGEVTGLPSRCRPQLRQVRRKSLLQLAGPARSDEGGPRRAPAQVDQQARSVGLRTGAGQRCRRGLRSARAADRANEDEAAAHRPGGLA